MCVHGSLAEQREEAASGVRRCCCGKRRNRITSKNNISLVRRDGPRLSFSTFIASLFLYQSIIEHYNGKRDIHQSAQMVQ